MHTDETALSTEHTEKRRALLELVTRRRSRYLSFLRARLRDPELAEDILQQVTVKILERSSQLQSAARAEAWLFRVLRNAVADQFRSNSTGGLAVDTDAAYLAAAAASHLPVLCPCATSQLDHLKPEYEEALRSHDDRSSGRFLCGVARDQQQHRYGAPAPCTQVIARATDEGLRPMRWKRLFRLLLLSSQRVRL
jgi:DNA-directed RNA polymerase specialized sigma24 family protein